MRPLLHPWLLSFQFDADLNDKACLCLSAAAVILHLIGGENVSATLVVKLIASDHGLRSSQSPRLQLSQGNKQICGKI